MSTPKVPAYGSDEVFEFEETVLHDANGNASADISVEYKCDYIEGWGAFSQYWTFASAEMSQVLTPIDQSLPTVSDFKISSDRYGLNASVSFKAGHASYKLTKVRFEFKCLTESQVKNRDSKKTQADSSLYAYDVGRNAYTLILEKTINLSKSNSITFDLDSADEKSHPLKSGGSYDYGLIITAENGKSFTKLGTLKVPQKVTGITCDSIINIVQGETAQLNYSVIPTNAQLHTVTFSSSDESIITVDSNGMIIAKETSEAFSSAVVTVKTNDGGYTAKCTVNVATSAAFPYIPDVAEYLTADTFKKMLYAVAVLRTDLINAGATVDALDTITVSGKDMPILSIMPAFVSFESNCQKLRKSAASLGLSTEPLSATPQKINQQNIDWFAVVNNWINFINNLHNQLIGGG